MPQTPTPNMGLVKPAENGDTGIWASLLDAMFDTIDTHNHTTGKGVKVPIATGTTVDADVPWSSGGNFYAITQLKAVDFQPSAAAGMTSYAGAMFVNSADSELYWRSTGGVNVKLTAGSSLNASVIGGIGGDYATIGALVDWIDASDTYRFRQELATGVRQYSRIQTGDVDLFEYKASPAGGVPSNRVRVKSPAALASSYDVTMPATTPASYAYVTMSSAGVLGTQTQVLTWPAAAAQDDFFFGGQYDGNYWLLNAGGSIISCPIPLPVGFAFSTWTLFASKGSNAAATMRAKLRDLNMATGAVVTVGAIQTNSANAPGAISFSGAGTTVAANHSYWLEFSCSAPSTDLLFGWMVTP